MEKLKYEAIATGFGLLEAPRVDDKGRIYFTDVSRGGVYRVIPGGKPETLIPGSARHGVGGLAFTEDGGLVMTGPSVALWYEGGQPTEPLKNLSGQADQNFQRSDRRFEWQRFCGIGQRTRHHQRRWYPRHRSRGSLSNRP